MPKREESYDIQETLEEYVKDYPDKEIKIINAAINSFSEKGFHRTNTKEIAARAGVAEGTIFRYFPTKDSIIERMVPLLIRIMQPKLEGPIKEILQKTEGAPVEQIFTAILRDRLRIIRSNGRFLKSMLPELIHRAPLLEQLKQGILPIVEKYVAMVLDSARCKGEIRSGLDPHVVTLQLMGFVLACSLLEPGDDDEKTEKDINKFMEYAMKGWTANEQD